MKKKSGAGRSKKRAQEKPLSRQALLDAAATLPSLTLTDRQYYDLEMLLSGAFAPLAGFLGEKDYRSVIERSRLTDGSIWPIPIVLDTNDAAFLAAVGKKYVLRDTYETPLALFEVSSAYKPDKKAEALAVYGTTDLAHPGVAYLFNETGSIYLGGKVTRISPGHFPFTGTRTPAELRPLLPKKGNIIAFQTRNPIHRAHYELITRSAAKHKAHILIHPVVGLTKPGDIEARTRIAVYKHIVKRMPKGKATLSLLPLAMRMAGPKEALWHALIRKNYGATHFIIGRDHAGPGKDSSSKPFYGPLQAQQYVQSFGRELGITIVPSDEIVYIKESDRFLPLSEVKDPSKIANISGTQFRAMLRGGEPIPEWFSFPEVIEELRKTEQAKPKKGFAIFLTGLSSAGKSTLARLLEGLILDTDSSRTLSVFDGDVVRKHLSKGLGFTREDRNANIERLGFVASEIVRHGGIAIVAAIAPYEEARAKNRARISRLGAYIEVFVDTPLKSCIERDTKGLYAKAKLGLAKGVTGIDDPYEKPTKPEIHLKTKGKTPERCAQEVMLFLRTQGLLP